jgi:hypothetical protein
MARLMLMAGGIIEPGGGRPGSVSAYVVLSAPQGSRIFKVRGATDAPIVDELPAATTVDLGRVQNDVAAELQPSLDEIRAQGGAGAITKPKAAWVCGVVQAYLRDREGLVVG